MIDTISLRRKIVDLAISGKLTGQLPEYGDAENLYNVIDAQIRELIYNKKIKKRKQLPVININEIPFEIPKSWKWVRLRDICTKIVDGDHNPPRGVSEKTDYLMLSAQNIHSDKLANFDSVRYLSEETFIEADKRTCLSVGDVLLTIVATLGRSCVYEGGYNVCFQRSVAVIHTLINPYYLKYVFDSSFIQHTMYTNATGAAQLGFYLNKVEKLLIPVPPVDEQNIIVEKIRSIMDILDTIDELQSAYSSDLEVLKSKIIDAGIQGKLTEQLPEDGNAEDLYAVIQGEKARLIKEKKIKKSKALPKITEDEIPFEIPDNWKWVHIGDIFNHNTGKALKRSNPDGELFEYITTSNLYWDRFDLDSLRTMHYKETELEKCTATKGDLLVCEGGDIGRAAIWNFDFDIKLQNHIHKLRPICCCINVRFYYYIFWSYKMSGRINGKGIGLQGLSANTLHALQVPLPPIDEQNRIVKQIDSLLKVIY